MSARWAEGADMRAESTLRATYDGQNHGVVKDAAGEVQTRCPHHHRLRMDAVKCAEGLARELDPSWVAPWMAWAAR